MSHRRKLLVISVLFIFTTVSKLYAADTTWGFDSASQYTYDTSVIEVTGGVAVVNVSVKYE